MPYNYQQHQGGGKCFTYSEESLQFCMEAVKLGALSINKTSKQHGLLQGTIQNKLKNIYTKSVGPPTVFSAVEEELLASQVVTL